MGVNLTRSTLKYVPCALLTIIPTLLINVKRIISSWPCKATIIQSKIQKQIRYKTKNVCFRILQYVSSKIMVLVSAMNVQILRRQEIGYCNMYFETKSIFHFGRHNFIFTPFQLQRKKCC
ncbi:hypothetical protein V8G54_012573 [Vigna mungo]|uniref:Uncharacterized protein n=1 Tax=Vigna mungo TaxID=3915 RepID=A0AAQ3NUH3_VIGMU